MAGTSFEVIDYGEASEVGTVDVAGNCELTFVELERDNFLEIERMVVICDSALSSIALVYAGDTNDASLRDATAAGNLDVADNAKPIRIPPGRDLIVRWQGASPGAVATASIQFAVLRKVLDARPLLG